MADWFDIFKAGADIYGATQSGKAAQQQAGYGDDMINFLKSQGAQSRADAIPLYQGASDARRGGYQQAMDIFGQTVPQQANVFQQGNVGAQNILGQGSQQYQNAILGLPVNRSYMEPQAIGANFDFLNQQLPAGPDYSAILGGQAPAGATGPNQAGLGTVPIGTGPGNQSGFPTTGGTYSSPATGGAQDISSVLPSGNIVDSIMSSDMALPYTMVMDALTGNIDATNTGWADVVQAVAQLSGIPGLGPLIDMVTDKLNIGQPDPEPNRPDSYVGGPRYPGGGGAGLGGPDFSRIGGGFGGGGNTGVISIGGDYQSVRPGK